MSKYRLYIPVFLGGFAVMSLEITASRILAPFLGTSIYVWTSLIGIILGALSLGYYYGGIKADQKCSFESLSQIFFAASGSVLFIIPFHYVMMTYLGKHFIDIRISSVMVSLLFFSLPGVLLGAISPFAFRLAVTDLKECASSAGKLFAISTIGSLAGTFFTGFVLLGWIGSINIVIILSGLLLFSAIISSPSYKPLTRILLLGSIIGMFIINSQIKEKLVTAGIIDLDTAYHRALIITNKDKETQRDVRSLHTDNMGVQSLMHLDQPNELVGDYLYYAVLALETINSPKEVLALGGGAYSLPKYLLAHYPEVNLDVVEIDPGMTKIANDYFFLTPTPQLRVFHQDARIFLENTNDKVYDFIFIDAFRSSPSIPFQLTTAQFFRKLSSRLKPDGIIAMNLINAIEGPLGQFARAELATLNAIGLHTLLFMAGEKKEPTQSQNLVIFATLKPLNPNSLKTTNPALQKTLGRLWTKDIPLDIPPLTDDFAPVEHYMMPVLTNWHNQEQS